MKQARLIHSTSIKDFKSYTSRVQYSNEDTDPFREGKYNDDKKGKLQSDAQLHKALNSSVLFLLLPTEAFLAFSLIPSTKALQYSTNL